MPLPGGVPWLRGYPDGPLSVFGPDGVRGPGQTLQTRPFLLSPAAEQRLLNGRFLLRDEGNGGDRQGPHRPLHGPAALRQLHCRPGDLPAQAGGDLQPFLAA